MERRFIGMLAKQTGVPIKTIRYYEEVGLLPKPTRTGSGYRLYSPQIAQRLQFIKKAQRFGLRLVEIREILELVDRGRCPCGHVQRLLQQRLADFEAKLKDLRSVQRQIRQALARPGAMAGRRIRGRAFCPRIEG